MTFVFKDYGYDKASRTAWFEYGHGNNHVFREAMEFEVADEIYDEAVFERALFLTFLTVGTSYWKCFPTREVTFEKGQITPWQADFLNKVYQEGMSQFAFENELTRDELASFVATTDERARPTSYGGEGILSLQSGGKDSLLVAQLLEENGQTYAPWYISSGLSYPEVLNELAERPLVARRTIDRKALEQAHAQGGKNGHVPVTFIVLSYAVLQAILTGKKTIVAAIGHEGDEPHAWIGDLPVNHQWSKTWEAEQLFAEFVERYISTDIQIGSPLRAFSELKVAGLFAGRAWKRFGASFSSCNIANYRQGADNSQLAWCGRCPKCANSYLLFSPFVAKDELDATIGKDLFLQPYLAQTFKGLLGIDDVIKPFECVGEIEELRKAYHLAVEKGYPSLPFDVPASSFDAESSYDAQSWATSMIRRD